MKRSLPTKTKNSVVHPKEQFLVDIFHESSHENHELQAVDLFCWGIHRKITHDDMEWFDIFKERIKSLEIYLG